MQYKCTTCGIYNAFQEDCYGCFCQKYEVDGHMRSSINRSSPVLVVGVTSVILVSRVFDI